MTATPTPIAAHAGTTTAVGRCVVRWRQVRDPAALAALAAIVCDTVSPVDVPTSPADPAGPANP